MRGTLVRYKDSGSQCWSRVDTPLGEPVYVSVAQSGVIVKNSNLGILGKTLYREADLDVLARTAMNVRAMLSEKFRAMLSRNLNGDSTVDSQVETFITSASQHLGLPSELTNSVLVSFTALALHAPSVHYLETVLQNKTMAGDTEEWIAYLQSMKT